MMRIAHVMGSLNAGGAEILELDVFRNAHVQNLNLVCIHRKRGVLYDEFLKTGIPFFELRPHNKFDIWYLFKLRKLIKEEKIDISHCHQPIDSLLVWLSTIGLKHKTVLTFHGHGFKAKFVGRCLQLFLLKVLPACIFVSKYTRNVYLTRFNLGQTAKYHVVYNGMDLKKFKISKAIKIREELKISKEVFLMGSVGNFTPVRDHMLMCRFLALLNKLNYDFHFIFVGKRVDAFPDLYDHCLAFCQTNNLQDRVTFLGVRDDVPIILQELDAFMYNSLTDTFGIAVIEAMYAGIPVFLNDWSVMLEVTDNGRHANIYASKDENDLMEKFEHYLNNVDYYKKKALKSSEFVRSQYSIDAHISGLELIYKSIVI